MLRFSSCQPGIYLTKFLIKFLPNSFSSHWWFFFFFFYYIHDFIRSLGSFKIHKTDFPGGSEVKNLPCNARDTSSIPGPGRSHMPRGNWACTPALWSPWATATEPKCWHYWSPSAWRPCSATKEVTATRSLCTTARELCPLATTWESLCVAMKTQCRQKYIF